MYISCVCVFDNSMDGVKQRGYLWLEGKKESVDIHLAPQGSRFTCARSADDDRHRFQRVQYRRKGYI